jgi:hypothetical protein
MAPFFSDDFPHVIRRIEAQIDDVSHQIVVLIDERHHRENDLDNLLSQPDSERRVALLLQQNDETASQIRTMQENVAQMKQRIQDLVLQRQVALDREEHQLLLYGGFLV